MIQLYKRELFLFGLCCTIAGMQLITFADRLESGGHAWVSLVSMVLYAAVAVGVILAARKRAHASAAA